MKFKQRVAAITVAAIAAVGLGVGTATVADAHTPSVGATCDGGVFATGTNYEAQNTNVLSVTLDGSTSTQVFSTNGTLTKPIPQDGLPHSWAAGVKTNNANPAYSKSDSGTITCGKQHTTVSVTFVEGKVVCDGTQPAYVNPSYTKSGSHVSWIILGAPGFGGSMILKAVPDMGYVIDGQSVFTHTFDAKPNAPDCRSTATPVAPKITQPECTGPGQSSAGSFTVPDNTSDLKYTVDGNTVYVHVPVIKQGDVKLAASLGDGWVRDSDVSGHYVVTYTNPGDCIIKTAPSIQVTQAECTGQGTSTGNDGYVTGDDGTVTYSPYNNGQDAVVTATPNQGYSFGDLPDGWTLQQDGSATFTVHYTIGSSSQCWVATPPSVTDPTCEKDGTLVIPDKTEGYYYTVSPAYDGPGTYHVKAHATRGNFLTGKTYWKLTVLPRDRSLCNEVTPVTPVLTEPTCTDGATFPLPANTESITYTYGEGEIVAQATSGNHFTEASLAGSGYSASGESDTLAVLVVPNLAPHLNCVTPVAPKVDQSVCKDGKATQASVTLTPVEGIVYTIDGNEVSGTVDVSVASNFTVVATATEGFVLAPGAQSSFKVSVHTVTCIITQIVKHPVTSLKTLAFTGAFGIVWYALGGLTLLAFGIILLAATRRRRNNEA